MKKTIMVFLLMLCVSNKLFSIDLSEKTTIFATIDASSFYCSLCLERFIKLCKLFEKNKQCHFCGIFIVKTENSALTDKEKQILKFKLKGLKKSNKLNFTFYLDETKSFGEKSNLIVFDRKTAIINKFELPLHIKDVTAILKLLK
ncbi:hypothetical protein KAR48_14735 [bacterium]|nr:hypothetical protein [bacterium]